MTADVKPYSIAIKADVELIATDPDDPGWRQTKVFKGLGILLEGKEAYDWAMAVKGRRNCIAVGMKSKR